MPRFLFFTAVLAVGLSASACANLGVILAPQVSGGTGLGGPLDQETVVQGLREALRVGSQRSIDRVGTLDGFLANELLRIALPEQLETMGRVLRQIGLRRQVEELEVAMNRAAEQAVGEAREVLWDEIRAINFTGAMTILRGGPTAATDYFQQRTETELSDRFHPIVVAKMESVGLSRLYADLAGRYNALPLTTKPAVDLEDYVTERALAGLFTVLGEEEARIRAEPLARTTELLRRVFSQATQPSGTNSR